MIRLDKLLELCGTLCAEQRELLGMGEKIAANAIGRALFYVGRAMTREILNT